MTRLAVALLALSVLAHVGCGDAKPPPAVVKATAPDARWMDAFDAVPDLLVVLHPQALRRDPVYGPILRRASALAAARSPAVAATRSFEVIEGATEVVIGMKTVGDDAGDIVLVMRGVPAEYDASKVVDADLKPLWRLANDRGKILEYQHAADTSLFVLPGRTWIIATGAARVRAREAFGQPYGRPPFAYDQESPISVRIDGPTFVAQNKKLREGGQLSNVGKHLKSLALALAPGRDGLLVARWSYGDEDAAAVAEVTMGRVVGALKRSEASKLSWLGSAEIERSDPRVVVVKAKLPAALLSDLATVRELPADDHWPSPPPQ